MIVNTNDSSVIALQFFFEITTPLPEHCVMELTLFLLPLLTIIINVYITSIYIVVQWLLCLTINVRFKD